MLYLASRSLDRHHLLARLGIPFSVLDNEVLEIRANNETCARLTMVTEVTVAPISADVIAAYVANGEPLDKAGAYAI